MNLRRLGDAVFLPLNKIRPNEKSVFTLVDIEDYDRVSRSRWSPVRRGGGDAVYAKATSTRFLASHHQLLHAYILRIQPGQRVDHISGDTLDNRKQNLRVATAAENAQNSKRPTFPGKTSRFKGVCWDKHAGRWRARIIADGAAEHLGLFEAEDEAALAYDEASLRLHGEFARTNATMRLFEQPDPFVPRTSQDGKHDGRIPHEQLSKRYRSWARRSYDERLTDNMRRLIHESGGT